METKTVLLKEALDFADGSGYCFAVYERNGADFVLKYDTYFSRVHENKEIIVKILGCGLDFNKFETKDGQHCFLLHNNCNVPYMIPIVG